MRGESVHKTGTWQRQRPSGLRKQPKTQPNFSFQNNMRAELKVGGLILLAAGLIVGASIVVTGWNPELDETYRVNVLFQTSSGLQTGSAVRVAGIKVGTVDAIELQGREALVVLKLYAKYPIYSDSAATIKSVGILGDKYVELLQGNPMSGTLQDNDVIEVVIPGSDIDSMIDSLSVILRDVKSVTGALDRSIGGARGEERLNRIMDNIEGLTRNTEQLTGTVNDRIGRIMAQIETFTADLAQISGENKDDVREILANLKDFSAQLEVITTENRDGLRQVVTDLNTFTDALAEDGPEITGNLRGILEENRTSLKSSVDNLDRSLAKLDRTMENVESISGKIDRGEGTIGKLVNDEQTVDGINDALDSVNGLLGGVNQLKLDIGVRAELYGKNKASYGPESSSKGYLSVQLQPLKDRYYLIELVDNPRGKRTRTMEYVTRTENGETVYIEEETLQVEQSLQFSAQVVQRFYDTLFKIGLFESKFGVGVEQIFGANEQYKVYFDMWDIGGEFGTHLKAGAYWRFHSNLYVVAGADDFISDEESFRDNYIGLGITFNEDVLKPFLSSVPLDAISN
jgi:phospholipid/cholesterol/gamma-HCH transport system substrate-binding protein